VDQVIGGKAPKDFVNWKAPEQQSHCSEISQKKIIVDLKN